MPQKYGRHFVNEALKPLKYIVWAWWAMLRASKRLGTYPGSEKFGSRTLILLLEALPLLSQRIEIDTYWVRNFLISDMQTSYLTSSYILFLQQPSSVQYKTVILGLYYYPKVPPPPSVPLHLKPPRTCMTKPNNSKQNKALQY